MFDLLHQWMVHVESGGAHFNGQGTYKQMSQIVVSARDLLTLKKSTMT